MIFTRNSIAAMFRPQLLGLEQAKDMTRRPVKEGERWGIADGLRTAVCYWHPNQFESIPRPSYIPYESWHWPSNRSKRIKWVVGRSYAIQPGRGQKQVGRFTLASITRELDVREMPPEDVAREGFRSLDDFLKAWAGLYGPNFFGPPLGVWALGMADVDIDERLLPPAVWQILEKAT